MMDFLLDSSFPVLGQQSSPGLPPVVQPNGPPQDDTVANMRAQWETQFASLEMPPPPPGVYASREELIASAKEWAERNGYTLVIGHSSKHQGEPSRCWLTCDLGGVYRNRHHLTPEMRKRKRESRKMDCPMRILGTKRKYEDGWLLHLPDPAKATHNHTTIARNESPIGPSEFPELEEALYEWHQQCVAEGIAVHGNTLKAKANELYKSMPIYRDRGPLPELGNGWLNDYRRRMGLPSRPTKQNSVPASRPSAASHYVNMEDSLPIHPSNRELFKATKTFVKMYMSRFDASHDYNHILRVLALSNRILALESDAFPNIQYDQSAVFLAALLHDVGDSKYAESGQDSENQIAELLLERGATDTLALKVQMIAKNVSYSNEVKNPRLVRAILSQHPELAIVQDADRLDAIGAIGIGRAFTFGGAKRQQEGMQGTIKHFGEKLEKLESMMKTETGKQMARERTHRIEMFKSWWEEESMLSYT